MRSRLTQWWRAVVDTVREVATAAGDHNVTMMAAALSYYLLVTLVPLGAMLTALLARAGVERSATLGMGDPDALAATVDAYVGRFGAFTYLVILLIVLYGASSVFSQYVHALSRIWGEVSERSSFYLFARRHLLGFVLLGILAVALVASLFLGAILSAATNQVIEVASQFGLPADVLQVIPWGRVAVDLGASFVLFTMSFSLVPNRKLRLRAVAPGAFITAVAYALGQVGLSYYLSTTSRVDLAGTMGQAIALLLWVYYSAMIALYGAELTRVMVTRKEARSQIA